MTDTAAGADSRFAAFSHPAYVRFWAARFMVTFATQVVSVAVGWQIYDLTRDPFDLGLVGLIQFAPALLLVLVTGAAADRYGRRLVMGLAVALEAACAAAILLLTLRGLTSPLPVAYCTHVCTSALVGSWARTNTQMQVQTGTKHTLARSSFNWRTNTL